jgi:hypothetical protein
LFVAPLEIQDSLDDESIDVPAAAAAATFDGKNFILFSIGLF